MDQYSKELKQILIQAQSINEVEYIPFTNFTKEEYNASIVVRNLLRELLEKVYKYITYSDQVRYEKDNVRIFSQEQGQVKALRNYLPNWYPSKDDKINEKMDFEKRRVFRNAERLIVQYSNDL